MHSDVVAKGLCTGNAPVGFLMIWAHESCSSKHNFVTVNGHLFINSCTGRQPGTSTNSSTWCQEMEKEIAPVRG